MARPVPIGEYQPQVPVQEGMRRIIPEARPVSTAPGLESIGEALDYKNRLDGEAISNKAIANLHVAKEAALAAPDLPKTDTGLQTVPNPTAGEGATGVTPPKSGKPKTFTESALESFDSAYQRELENAGSNPYARRAINQAANSIRAEVAIRGMRQEAAANVEARANSAVEAANRAATAVEMNPDSWQSIGAQQQQSIRNMGLDPEVTVKLAHEADRIVSEAAARGYAKKSPEDALKRMQNPDDPLFGGMNPHSKEVVKEYATNQAVQQHADGIVDIYRKAGPTAGAKAFSDLDKSDLPQEIKDRVLAEAHRGLGQYQAEQRQKYGNQIIALEEGIASGKPADNARAQVWDLHGKGVYSPEETAAKLAALDRIAEKGGAEDGNLQWALQAYKDRRPLDPKNADSKKAIDGLFGALADTNKLQGGTPEYTNLAADIAKATGIAPDTPVSWARAQLVSGDATKAAQGADLLARLNEATPRGFVFENDPKTEAMVRQISDITKAGGDPELAVQVARKNAEIGEVERKELEIKWRQIVPEKSAAAISTNSLVKGLSSDERFKPGFFTGVPDVPKAMTAEFAALTHEYYLYTGGDVDKARELATDTVKRTWGVTEVNGKRELMKYAPEAMYPGISVPVIRKDLESSIAEQGFSGKPESVRLVPTADTARTAGQIWSVAAPDKHGAYDIVLGKDGRPLQYQLPVGTNEFEAARQKLASEGMDKARRIVEQTHEAEHLQQQALDQEMEQSTAHGSLRFR